MSSLTGLQRAAVRRLRLPLRWGDGRKSRQRRRWRPSQALEGASRWYVVARVRRQRTRYLDRTLPRQQSTMGSTSSIYPNEMSTRAKAIGDDPYHRRSAGFATQVQWSAWPFVWIAE